MPRVTFPSGPATVVLALLLALGSLVYTHRGLPWYLWSGDAREYAVMARRLAQGEGFTTGVIFPAEVSFGTDRRHPAVTRPPGWPALIGPFFAALGPHEWIVHALVFLCHFTAIAGAMALAQARAGGAAGIIAGVATATTQPFLIFAVDGTSEPLFAALITAVFLLCARDAHPFWIGATCGLAYLTRYNGLVLLPALLLLVAARRRRVRPCLALLAGFAVVGAPWWARNVVVAGDPTYSLLNLNLYMSTRFLGPHQGLLYTLAPDLSSPLAMSPLAKAAGQLPALLAQWPLASANLVACLGVALACLRRDLLSLAFAVVAGATTVGISLALARGRYFMPLVPTLLALGVAGWARHGGRLRIPALALLLAAPLLPEIPAAWQDIAFQQAVMARTRAAYRDGRTGLDEKRDAARALSRCLGPNDLVIAEDAAEIAWLTDTIAIQMPMTEADFWTIVDEHPVRYARGARLRRISRDAFAARFRPRSDCGPDLYERRDGG
jgi:4-amino-4-deoxy-L-arabinose transferase-like glycosyltransferase